MGKGDKKTKRGKLFTGSYGVTRPRKGKKAAVTAKPEAKKTTAAKKKE
ncbi:MAG: 30S ribosomal protein THX [Bacteroidales bacterium]|nr:30S ribosomal protein THX [Bacteroidales bacterium]